MITLIVFLILIAVLALPVALVLLITYLLDRWALRRHSSDQLTVQEPSLDQTATDQTQSVASSLFQLPGLDFFPEGNRGLLTLFYLGAFFVLAAALAFVGFGESNMAAVKLVVLLAVTGFFAISGYAFARQEKLYVAGIVYVGISLLFIPIDGIAFHYLGSMSVSGDLI